MPRKKTPRTINQRQKERINAIRQRRSDQITARQEENWDILKQADLGKPEEGMVIAHFGLNVEVEDSSGVGCRCAVRETAGIEPVCGDRVIWQKANSQQGVITAVIDRHSILQRPGPYRRLKTIAANIDQIFIITTSTHLNTGLIDRYLVAAEAAKIRPILLINKMDLAQDPEEIMEELAPYKTMEYPILPISATSGLGISELGSMLQEKISIFVGQSGVGKSSLVHKWVPKERAPTIGEVKESSNMGRHTTTVARLYHLPNGGSLIDSPGVREFGLHNVSRNNVATFFRDIAPYLEGCRFSNCSHKHEPGCMVLGAIEDGKIHINRLKSLHRIQESMPKNDH
ncbi:MAG: small ribosomal subunit biogenesis GTPase RsgA [Magnetococcales bacterium]|nr:small ribosomal subunit biogenesis GTPase RsgA [Magnetococcales bacterium]